MLFRKMKCDITEGVGVCERDDDEVEDEDNATMRSKGVNKMNDPWMEVGGGCKTGF